MTIRGFLIRFVLVALFTWIVGAIFESFGWALYWALYLLWLYELVRPRRQRIPRHPQTPETPDQPPTQRLP